jgi:hypothetical protein
MLKLSHCPPPSFCYFNSALERLLSLIIPQSVVVRSNYFWSKVVFSTWSKLFEKNFFFNFQRQGEFRPEVYSVEELLPGRISKFGPSILHRTHHRVAPSSEETDQVLLNQRRHQFLMAYSYKQNLELLLKLWSNFDNCNALPKL